MYIMYVCFENVQDYNRISSCFMHIMYVCFQNVQDYNRILVV